MIIKTSKGKELDSKKIKDAIRIKCLDCCGFCPNIDHKADNKTYNEAYQYVKDCDIEECALWPYRLGKNPFHAKSKTQDNGEN